MTDEIAGHLVNAIALDTQARQTADRTDQGVGRPCQLAQMEAGPFFDFVKTAIEPLNEVLVTKLHRKPVSAARLTRYDWRNAATIYPQQDDDVRDLKNGRHRRDFGCGIILAIRKRIPATTNFLRRIIFAIIS
jgi:hypothetical protein